MNFLPYSNGVRKVSMKKHRSPKEKFKIVVITIVAILIIGIVTQNIVDFIDGERLKKRVNYTTVDELRMDYRIEGEGSYTIIFDEMCIRDSSEIVQVGVGYADKEQHILIANTEGLYTEDKRTRTRLTVNAIASVSYTHLDVYKRQTFSSGKCKW